MNRAAFLDDIYEMAMIQKELPSEVFSKFGESLAIKHDSSLTGMAVEAFLCTVSDFELQSLDDQYRDALKENKDKLTAIGMSEKDFL